MEWLWDHLHFDEMALWLSALAENAGTLLDPSKRLSVWPILTTILIAWLVFAWRQRREAGFGAQGFWRYLLPRSIWKHKSTRVDVQVAVFNAVVRPARILVFGITIAAAATLVAEALDGLLGPSPLTMPDTWTAVLLLGAIIFLLTDLSTYLVHRLSHEVPFLWSFHRLHHSAQVLNPLTLQRKHPVYSLLSRLLDLAIVAPVMGVVLYFWPEETGTTVTLIVRWAFGLFALAGGNLRHSHVWLSFGPLERVLVSPAQHQIHHSRERKHWDRNYGEVLAVWDWMFGTLYATGPVDEKPRFGIARGVRQPHPTLKAALVEPFAYAYRVVRPSTGADDDGATFADDPKPAGV